MAPPTRFPTLADRPRASWPTTLRVTPPDPFLQGDVERVRCPLCTMPRIAQDTLDFSALPVATRAALHLDAVYLCQPCFQTAWTHGRILHSAIGTALGFAPHVVAALEQGERQSLRAGAHVITPVNAHLKPK